MIYHIHNTICGYTGDSKQTLWHLNVILEKTANNILPNFFVRYKLTFVRFDGCNDEKISYGTQYHQHSICND